MQGSIRFALAGFLLSASWGLHGCGGSSKPGANAPSSSNRAGLAAQQRPAMASGLSTSLYVPALATCASMPGDPTVAPSPVPSTTTRVSGYRVCGPFTATSGAFSFSCPLPTESPTAQALSLRSA